MAPHSFPREFRILSRVQSLSGEVGDWEVRLQNAMNGETLLMHGHECRDIVHDTMRRSASLANEWASHYLKDIYRASVFPSFYSLDEWGREIYEILFIYLWINNFAMLVTVIVLMSDFFKYVGFKEGLTGKYVKYCVRLEHG